MTAEKTGSDERAFLARHASYLIATAARAPSVHNTQPWRFRVTENAIELYADPGRKLAVDPLGREMLISCGAAVLGLRLAVRSLGHLPVVTLFPEPARLRLLARVRIGKSVAITRAERRMAEAVPHRHTHRGPFDPEPLPGGLLAGLQHDVMAEGAELVLPDGTACAKLVAIAGSASRAIDLGHVTQAETVHWTRSPGDRTRDGVPAYAFAGSVTGDPTRLPQRDFDVGRGFGLLSADGPTAAATAVLVTAQDRRSDWLQAGQALYRLLLHAASQWVFASLYTQPLEAAKVRELLRERLTLPGWPQVLLQLGVARTTWVTARRRTEDLIDQEPPG